jgi:hypothetical protein
MKAWPLFKTVHLMSLQYEFEASFTALGRSNSYWLPFLLDQRHPIPRNQWIRVYLGLLSKETPAIGVLNRREAHHIHGSCGSGKLTLDKVSSPGGQGISIAFRLLRCTQRRVESRDGKIGPAADGTNHGAFRELGSANAAEAHSTAGSGRLRRLL